MTSWHVNVDYCRLCAVESKDGVEIYSEEGTTLCLEEKIIQYLKIQISQHDQLPKKVCGPCHSRLKDCCQFAEQAKKVQHTLELLMQRKNLSYPNEVRAETECSVNKEEIEAETILVKTEPIDFLLQVVLHSDTDDQDSSTADDNIEQSAASTSVKSPEKPDQNPTPDFECERKSEEGYSLKELGNGESDDLFQEKDESIEEDLKANCGIKCNQCGKSFPVKSVFDNHYRSSYNKKPEYTCSYCNKTMLNYPPFRAHFYRHKTENRYRCEYCQKGFYIKTKLNEHFLAKHTAVKPYMCDECGKRFITKAALNTHFETHNEKLEIQCDDCGKILHTRWGLTAHKRVHELGRCFMCHVCGKTFTQKGNMQEHVKQHSEEKPYTCDKCGKSFGLKSRLNGHFALHNESRPFQCQVCMKVYKTKRYLKNHARIHSDARPHVCTYCNKGFLSTQRLRQHYNIHTGERPYVCKFCECSFTNYPNYLKHMRRRHKVEPRDLRSLENKEETTVTSNIIMNSRNTQDV